MKITQKYKQYYFRGEWHIHTSYTDGKNTVFDYCKLAKRLGIPLLAFTEHVRLNLSYDFNKLLEDIKTAREEFPELIILSGIEAKILSNGKLDCPDKILEKVNYKLFAFHSFPENIDKYIFSLKNILNNYTVDAWAHPGLFFKKYSNLKLPDKKLNQIFILMNGKNVLLEINLKHSLPKIDWIIKYLKVIKNNSIVFGTDVHCVEDLYQSWKIKQEFLKLRPKTLSDKIDVTAFMVWFIEKYPDSKKS